LNFEEKAVSEQEKEKAKEKAQLDRFIAAAKEKVEKYFEDPSNELAKKGFEGAKNWAVENDSYYLFLPTSKSVHPSLQI
jgi:hypothetical protein